MSAEPKNSLSCAFCGLPVVAPRRLRRSSCAAGEALYCCSGCRFAASILAAEATEGHARRVLMRLGLAIFCAMNVSVFSMALWGRDVYADRASDATPLAEALADLFRYGAMTFSLPVLLLLGGPLLANAWQAARRAVITSDILILFGVVAAYLYSTISVLRGSGPVYFEVGCVVLVFVTLGRWFEATGKLKAGHALDALARLLPATVHRVRGGAAEDVPREAAVVGDELRVLAGERFGVDGRIVSGAADVDEQLVTGESRTVSKHPGDDVFSGTLNVDGDLRIRVTAAAGAETVSRLLALVRQARQVRGQYQRLADRIAEWFVPAVCLVAIATAIWHGRESGIDAGILAGLSVVLIACPCALGLATPMAVWSAMGRAAQGHVLFRSGRALERLATIRVVFFDKTGTLTSGNTSVEALLIDRSADRDDVLARSAVLAGGSNHVFSAAINAYIEMPKRIAAASGVAILPGKGISVDFDLESGEDSTYLGSRRLMAERGLEISESLQRSVDVVGADSPLAFIGWGRLVRGVFVFREQLRPNTASTLAACRQLGLDVTILTGDRRSPALLLQTELETPVIAEQLPEDKVSTVERARRDGHGVAMVGDGINDAPALAAADVGIAMGCGADLSRESAAVCLLSNDLSRLPWTIALARQTVRVIRQNLFWAFVYNVGGIGLAVSGRLNPVWAGAAMMVSSLLVITNSLRLAHFPDGMTTCREPGNVSASTPDPDPQSTSRIPQLIASEFESVP